VHEPSIAAMARLTPIEAAVDEDSREPDLERPLFAIRSDVTEYLDEGVLHGFVRVRRVAEILIGNPDGPSLVDADERREAISCFVELTALDEPSNLNREAGIVGHLRGRATATRLDATGDSRGFRIPVVSPQSAVLKWPQINTHEGITIRAETCLQSIADVTIVDLSRFRRVRSFDSTYVTASSSLRSR
jgi:hypothetical protein